MLGGSSASGFNGPQGVPLAPPPAPAGPPPAGAGGQFTDPPPQKGSSHQWWAQAPVPDPVDEPYYGDHKAPAARSYRPPDVKLTTLGWLKHLDSPSFPYFEIVYLKYLHKVLTTDWPLMQGGTGPETLQMWLDLVRVLELDSKAKRDLMLMAHSGVPGRTCANNVLWSLCSYWALQSKYEDLSHKVSSELGWYRRTFDRPPQGHDDLRTWSWKSYKEPWDKVGAFDPRKVPHAPSVSTGPGGRPLPPPYCWQGHQ